MHSTYRNVGRIGKHCNGIDSGRIALPSGWGKTLHGHIGEAAKPIQRHHLIQLQVIKTQTQRRRRGGSLQRPTERRCVNQILGKETHVGVVGNGEGGCEGHGSALGSRSVDGDRRKAECTEEKVRLVIFATGPVDGDGVGEGEGGRKETGVGDGAGGCEGEGGVGWIRDAGGTECHDGAVDGRLSNLL